MFRVKEGVIMKKYKRVIIISVITILLFLFTAGCSQTTEKEKVLKAIENQLKLNSYTMTGSMNFEQSSQSLGSDSFNIEVLFEGKYQKEPFYQMVDMSYDVKGLIMQAELYSKDHEIWMKMPMYSQYIYLDTYEYAEEHGIDIQKQRELDDKMRNELQVKIFESLDETDFSLIKDNKGEKVSEVIMVNITNEDADHLIEIFGGLLMTNFINDTKKDFEELKNSIEITELSIKIGIDKKLIKYEEFSGIINLKANKGKQVYQDIGFNILLNYDDFNKKLNFNFPDFEDEGIIRYEEFFDYPLK